MKYHFCITAAFSGPKSPFAKLFIFYGELAGNRTQDPRLKRALLYQLSYELADCRFLKVTTGSSGPPGTLQGALLRCTGCRLWQGFTKRVRRRVSVRILLWINRLAATWLAATPSFLDCCPLPP